MVANDEKLWGSFIALPLKRYCAEKVLERLAPSLRKIPMQFSNPDYLHLTLAYCGWLNKKEAAQIIEELNSISFPTRALTTGKIISLGHGGDSSYIAIEVKGCSELLDARTRLSRRLFQGKVDRASNWLPHVSLGRAAANYQVSAHLADVPPFLEFDKVGLFRSVDHSERIELE